MAAGSALQQFVPTPWNPHAIQCDLSVLCFFDVWRSDTRRKQLKFDHDLFESQSRFEMGQIVFSLKLFFSQVFGIFPCCLFPVVINYNSRDSCYKYVEDTFDPNNVGWLQVFSASLSCCHLNSQKDTQTHTCGHHTWTLCKWELEVWVRFITFPSAFMWSWVRTFCLQVRSRQCWHACFIMFFKCSDLMGNIYDLVQFQEKPPEAD